jgi:hypothetical protein
MESNPGLRLQRSDNNLLNNGDNNTDSKVYVPGYKTVLSQRCPTQITYFPSIEFKSNVGCSKSAATRISHDTALLALRLSGLLYQCDRG